MGSRAAAKSHHTTEGVTPPSEQDADHKDGISPTFTHPRRLSQRALADRKHA